MFSSSPRSSRRKKTIFVTVGTTKFDLLIEGVTTPEALQWMNKNGYTHLIIQYGKGTKPRSSLDDAGLLTVETYDFKSSLGADMAAADLVLSHAGAGTVMEALRLGKRLVVVINTALMDNHQTELAHAMAKRGHLFVVEQPEDLNKTNSTSSLMETWNDFDSFVPIPHQGGDPNDFSNILNQHMGVVSLPTAAAAVETSKAS
uniref:UDP-N-acetylglucosamine transferase subunit ALG13 n=1 Tax=Grammatophora oceanica TaxID=210454 RepID=A0A7S1VH43_9STRA|mmetsp:Transcript_46368/g.69040  ORF Transcript_46368/g.69040 Transcript_46368/m.69040 type:complete len:202 (+) Transcript_46368:121-726(+)